MKLPAFECCVCNQFYAMTDGTLPKILYPSAESLPSGHLGFSVTSDYYPGIRGVCKWCITGFQNLEVAKEFGP